MSCLYDEHLNYPSAGTKKLNLKLLSTFMSDVEDEVVKPIKRTGSQKILKKLELIDERLTKYLINLNQSINSWIKTAIFPKLKECLYE